MLSIELSLCMGIDTIYGGMYEQVISSVSSLNATDKTPNYWNVADFAFGVLRLEYIVCIGFFWVLEFCPELNLVRSQNCLKNLYECGSVSEPITK